MTEQEPGLRAELREGRWCLAGAADGELINGYLGYLVSPVIGNDDVGARSRH